MLARGKDGTGREWAASCGMWMQRDTIFVPTSARLAGTRDAMAAISCAYAGVSRCVEPRRRVSEEVDLRAFGKLKGFTAVSWERARSRIVDDRLAAWFLGCPFLCSVDVHMAPRQPAHCASAAGQSVY